MFRRPCGTFEAIVTQTIALIVALAGSDLKRSVTKQAQSKNTGAKIAYWRRTARRSRAIPMSRTARPACRFRRSRRLRWSVVGAATLLTSCAPAGVLDPQGPIASAERLLLINSTAIMLVVVVPVIIATLAFAWWYRSSNTRATRSLDESYEGRVTNMMSMPQ